MRRTRGKTPGKGYASGMGALGILLKTLTSIRVRTPPSGELPGVLPLLQRHERMLARLPHPRRIRCDPVRHAARRAVVARLLGQIELLLQDAVAAHQDQRS